MKLIKTLFYALIACAALYSCKSDDSDVKVSNITISTQDFILTEIGATKTIEWAITPSDASNKNVSWTSRSNQVATVDQAGKVTAVANGNTYIVVNTADGNKKDSVQVTVNVAAAISDITLDAPDGPIVKGTTYALSCTSIPHTVSNDKLKWTSRNTNIATVDNYGVVTAKNVGSTYIVAEETKSGLKDSVEITVISAISNVSIDQDNFSLPKGGEYQLTYTTNPADVNVTWDSKNTYIAAVSASGQVTANNIGNTYIYLRTEDPNVKDSIKITVVEPVTGVSVSPTEQIMYAGASLNLTPAIEPANATNKKVTWSSSDNNVATVNSNGKVTTKAAGNVVITVTTDDGGKQATADITVVNADISGRYPGNLKGTTHEINAIVFTLPAMPINQNGEMVVVQNSATSASVGIDQTILGMPIQQSIDCDLSYGPSKGTLIAEETVKVIVPANEFGVPEGDYDFDISIDGYIDIDGKAVINMKIRYVLIAGLADWDVFTGTFTGEIQ